MSQFSVSGVVDSVSTKTKSTKFGDKIINYVVVDGQEFSTGFKKVFNQGEMVNIVVEFKFGEHQLVEGMAANPSLPKLGSVASAPPKKAWGGGGGGGNKGTFPVLPTDGQMSIIRQSSMNRAVDILGQWIAAGTWTPSGTDDYMHKLHEVALTITDFGSGGDIMQLKAAQAGNMSVVA